VIEAYGNLLEFCGHFDMARRLVDAVRDCIASGERTRDLGGSLGTIEFTDAVLSRATPRV
jgi:isocitrate/isopropylmalate dehydrogenase